MSLVGKSVTFGFKSLVVGMTAVLAGTLLAVALVLANIHTHNIAAQMALWRGYTQQHSAAHTQGAWTYGWRLGQFSTAHSRTAESAAALACDPQQRPIALAVVPCGVCVATWMNAWHDVFLLADYHLLVLDVDGDHCIIASSASARALSHAHTALRQAVGVQRHIVLVGQSTDGAAAAVGALALDQKHRIAAEPTGLLLISTPSSLTDVFDDWVAAALPLARDSPAALVLSNFTNLLTRDGAYDIVGALTRLAARPHATAVFVALVHAQDDDVVSVQHAQRIHDALGGDYASLHTPRTGGHAMLPLPPREAGDGDDAEEGDADAGDRLRLSPVVTHTVAALRLLHARLRVQSARNVLQALIGTSAVATST